MVTARPQGYTDIIMEGDAQIFGFPSRQQQFADLIRQQEALLRDQGDPRPALEDDAVDDIAALIAEYPDADERDVDMWLTLTGAIQDTTSNEFGPSQT